ncbi:MAG: HAMP domain-containing protein, partial [Burkholderiales bacterium]
MISRSANLRGSIAARLAFGYGLLVALSITAIIGVLYVGTVGVLEKSIDAKINAISARMLQRYRLGGETALQAEIAAQLADRVDTDSELLLLLSPQGRTIAGNLKNWTQRLPDKEEMSNTFLSRDGRQFLARFISHPLDGKGFLIIGRDMSELEAIRQVIERALLAGAAFSLMLAACGTWIFRRAIERRIGRIRLATTQIAAGDLTRRIEVQGDDEFARLNADINSMLDRIEELMEGVRHVSNSIAHDIRTPLSRVRARLENAVLTGNNLDSLAVATGAAIDDIDRLISMFDKLLQIAAAESGVGGASFQR